MKSIMLAGLIAALAGCGELGVTVKTERLESVSDSSGTYTHNRTTIDYYPLCHGSCKEVSK